MKKWFGKPTWFKFISKADGNHFEARRLYAKNSLLEEAQMKKHFKEWSNV